jgi:hypothetical protein
MTTQERTLQCVRAFAGHDYDGFLKTYKPDDVDRNHTFQFGQMMCISLQRLGPRRSVDETVAAMLLKIWAPCAWESALLRLTFGQADIADVVNLAQTDVQRCQAHYYAGARLQTFGESASAQLEFETCVRVECRCLEFHLAWAEVYGRLR